MLRTSSGSTISPKVEVLSVDALCTENVGQKERQNAVTRLMNQL